MLAGMRSMAPLALVSLEAPRRTLRRSGLRRLITSSIVSKVLPAAALGEMAADKAPQMPSRTDALPLLGRALSGMAAGALLSQSARGRRMSLALTGGAAAVASTYLFYHLRQSAGRRFRVPDLVLGLSEDLLVFAVGSRIAPHLKRA